MKGKEIIPAPGSIKSVSAGKPGGEALAMLRAKVILVCDRSGSMATADAMHGKARYEVEDRVVADLQVKYPGQIIITAFAESAIVCTNGELPYPDGGATVFTNAFALAAKLRRGDMRVILLTDGEATDPQDAVLEAAKPLIGHLDIIYIGSDMGAGRHFLGNLAKLVDGTCEDNSLSKESRLLQNTIERLMLKAGK